MRDNAHAFKKAILNELCALLTADRELLLRAAIEAREAATHSESLAEDKYDTRGLEASYLAGAQAERVRAIEKSLTQYKFFEAGDFSATTPIAVGALVELSSDAKKMLCFIVPHGIGRRIVALGKDVQVVTAQSPLGSAMIGRTLGEEFTLAVGAKSSAKTPEYEITQVF